MKKIYKTKFLLIIIIIVSLALPLFACGDASVAVAGDVGEAKDEEMASVIPDKDETEAAEKDQAGASGDKYEAPLLSDDLKTGCQSGQIAAQKSIEEVGFKVDDRAVDFTLKDTQGNEVTLSGLLAEKPVLMIFGAFT